MPRVWRSLGKPGGPGEFVLGSSPTSGIRHPPTLANARPYHVAIGSWDALIGTLTA